MRKPSTRPKACTMPSVADGGWTKRESIVALVSIIVAAIGLVVSAASSVFAWQQVRLLNKERMSPYRAILYNAKVSSYQDIITAANRYEYSVNEVFGDLITWYQNPSLYVWNSNELISESHESESAYQLLRESLFRGKVIWSGDIYWELNGLEVSAERTQECLRPSVLGLPREAFVRRCQELLPWGQQALIRYRESIERMMREDIRADQLQAIGTD